jgi:branched-chain amino acid transport system substrate-binding protein
VHHADETRNAGVLHFVGGEAVGITTKGHPSLFRTSFTQATAMPQFAHYIKDRVRVGSMAVVWVQNEFGKGGRDEIVKALQAQGIKIVADLPVVPRQSEFSDIVSKIKQADPDAVFLYLNEDESPFLRKRCSVFKPPP